MPEQTTQPHRRSQAFANDPLGAALQSALAPTYVVVRRLGGGAMGSVYLARDPLLKRFVAVKVLAPELSSDEVARARFRRESLAVAAISHPNVVGIYSVGALPDQTPYYVMQYVEGSTLAELVATQGRLPVRTALRALRDVASGLAAAHRQGIVHRDVKLENLLVDAETGRVLVSDFGVAGIFGGDEHISDGDLRITRAGMTLGTPAYMSPEQLLAEPLTDRSDVYALGILGYELLSGHGPYLAHTPRELAAAHLRDTPLPLDVDTGDSGEVAALLLECIAKSARERPSAAEVARRLSPETTEVVEWPPPGMEMLHGRGRRFARRLVTASLVASLSFALLVGPSREGSAQLLLPPTALLFAAAIVGVAMLLRALAGARIIADWAMHAVRAGYSWRTVAEVLADARGDGGALLAGIGPYASLPVHERTTLRAARIIRFCLQLGGGLLPLAGVFIGLRSHGDAGAGFLGWVLLPAAIALVTAWLVGLLERTSAPRREYIAARRRTESVAPLAEGWYAALDTDDPPVDSKRKGRAVWPVRVGIALAGVLVLVGASLILLLALLTGVSEIQSARRQPTFVTAQARAAQLAPLRVFRLPADPSITPMQAGVLLNAVSRPTQTSPWLRADGPSYPPARSITPDRVFPRENERAWPYTAMKRAGRGLAPAERALLDSMAADPAADGVIAVGRAAQADIVGGRYAITPTSQVSVYALPVMSYARLRSAVHGALARAVLARAAGDRARADSLVRAVLGASFLIIDNSPLLIDDLLASNALRLAADGLFGLAEVNGDIERLGRLAGLASRIPPAIGEATIGERNVRQYFAQRVRNEELPIALRWSGLEVLAGSQCTDAHDLVFGSESYDEALRYARSNLARTPGEQALLGLFERSFDDPRVTMQNAPSSPLTTLARLADGVTGGHRFESCARYILMGAAG